MESENNLLSLLRKYDHHAFNCLYERYASVLYGVISEATPNTKIAKHILQESFVEVWRHLHSFDLSEKSLFAWILAITLKQCREILCLPISWYIYMYKNHRQEQFYKSLRS